MKTHLYQLLLNLVTCLYTSRRQGFVQNLVMALEAVPDDSMRQLRYVELLRPLPPELGVEVLHGLLDGSLRDLPGYRAVLGSVLDITPLVQSLGEDGLQAWLEASLQLGRVDVKALLTSRPPRRQYYAPHHVDVNEYFESPLGRRKSLARSFNRQILDRLLFDKHPGVIRILLENPRIVESDVIKIAALQPTTARALHELFVHPRWSRRYSVKKALVFNPYNAVSVSIGLLGFLHEQDLEMASRSRRLAPELREQASAVLRVRRELRRPPTAVRGLPVTEQAPEPVREARGDRQRHEQSQEEEGVAAAFLAELLESGLSLEPVEALPHTPGLEPARPRPEPLVLEPDAMQEAAAFLRQLPRTLTLRPVSEDEEED